MEPSRSSPPAEDGDRGDLDERRRGGGVLSVAKALVILNAFSSTVPVLSLRQIEARTGIPRATGHALCSTLVAHGFLLVEKGRGYQLGPSLLLLGGQVIQRTGLLEAAKDVAKRVALRPGTEAHLGQLVGGWIVFLDRTRSSNTLPKSPPMGARLLATATPCGLAALAELPTDEAMDRVHAAHDSERRTRPDNRAVIECLSIVRRQRFAISESRDRNRWEMGAAIVGPFGQPVGGVSISASISDAGIPGFQVQALSDLNTISSIISRRLLGQDLDA